MTLTDLYCVYNRARGIDLISPNDLLKATEKLGTLGVGIELKAFASLSLNVVKLSCLDEKHICSEIISVLKNMDDQSGLDSLSIAKALNISVDIAKAQLRTALDLGFICEDSYPYGTCYFQNLFDQFLVDSLS